MSNRRRPRVQLRPDGGVLLQTGIEQYIDVAPDSDPTIVPGEHCWVAIAAYQVLDPTATPMHFDRENLLSVNLGCYVCEQPYSADLAAKACGGEPS